MEADCVFQNNEKIKESMKNITSVKRDEFIRECNKDGLLFVELNNTYSKIFKYISKLPISCCGICIGGYIYGIQTDINQKFIFDTRIHIEEMINLDIFICAYFKKFEEEYRKPSLLIVDTVDHFLSSKCDSLMKIDSGSILNIMGIENENFMTKFLKCLNVEIGTPGFIEEDITKLVFFKQDNLLLAFFNLFNHTFIKDFKTYDYSCILSRLLNYDNNFIMKEITLFQKEDSHIDIVNEKEILEFINLFLQSYMDNLEVKKKTLKSVNTTLLYNHLTTNIK